MGGIMIFFSTSGKSIDGNGQYRACYPWISATWDISTLGYGIANGVEGLTDDGMGRNIGMIEDIVFLFGCRVSA